MRQFIAKQLWQRGCSFSSISSYTRIPKEALEDPDFKIYNPETHQYRQVLKPIKIGKFINIQDLAFKLDVSKDELQRTIQMFAPTGKQLNYSRLAAQDIASAVTVFNGKIDTDEPRVPRPPIVTIMGHVDHGKTTLLDFLRNSQIAKGEYGGITQKIGAFHVTAADGQKITFIDTPGHEAFSNMRVRGAQFTDIIILVVSCADGVQPQTQEVISIAYNFRIPMIVAINKIDLPGVQTEEIEKQLIEEGRLALEGATKGNIPVVHISGKTGKNLDLLVELVQFQGEYMQLQSQPNQLAEGFVLEARQQRTLDGAGSTLIVQDGTIKQGDYIVIGENYAKIRVIKDDQNRRLTSAGPSSAVEISGLHHTPQAGEQFICLDNEKLAKLITNKRQIAAQHKRIQETVLIDGQAGKIKIANRREKFKVYGSEAKLKEKYKEAEDRIIQKMVDLQVEEQTEFESQEDEDKYNEAQKVRLEELAKLEKQLHDQKIYIDEMVDGDIEDDSTLNLILKGPDFGTVESIQILIKRVIEEHRDEDLDVRIIECGVGDISPKDIKEAKTHNATVLTLNVEHSSPEVGRLARSLGIKTHQHRIIYALLDDFKAIMVQLRDRARNTDKLAGSGVIKQIFSLNLGKRGSRKVFGALVKSGTINKKHRYRLLRNGVMIVNDLELVNLKHFKEEAQQIESGKECGLTFLVDVEGQVGDEFEAYVPRKTN